MSQSGNFGGFNKLFSLPSETLHAPSEETLCTVPIEQVRPGPFQARFSIDQGTLSELADSIREHGIIQPVVVRNLGEDGYEIIAGERRWLAAQQVPLHEIPVLVKIVPNQAALAVSLIENIQRENLNAVEEASLLKRLADEYSLTHAELAKTIGRSRASVTNKLRLLNLRPTVLNMLRKEQLGTGHAKALLSLDGHEQEVAARHAVMQSLSVRATEQLVKSLKKTDAPPSAKPLGNEAQNDTNFRKFETQLSAQVGVKVSIRGNSKKGYIRIEYRNLDELDGIIDRIVQAETVHKHKV